MEKFNLNREIISPLSQFEIRDLLSLDAPILGNLHISITNIGLFLMLGGLFILALNLLSTNYNRLVGNNWSISQESLYATIHSIVTNQINPKNGQMYFPFIYALFIFILINNLIGMVKRCLWNFSLFILNYHAYSTQIKNSSYSTHSHSNFHSKTSKNKPRYSFNNKNTFYLNPGYITGFVDGEGCFSLSIFKDIRRLTGWQVKPIFSIALHNKDITILEAIQRTFKVGKIYKHGINSMQYRVSSLKDLQVILEHFDQYPLITKKQEDYLLFKQAINLIINKEHLSFTGLLKLVSIKATLNWGLSEKFKESFPTVKPIDRPNSKFTNTFLISGPFLAREGDKDLTFNWIRGFTEAEGSFQVIIQNIQERTHISLRFSITQHIKDEILLTSIVAYLGCRRYYRSSTRNEGQYLVTVFSDIDEKIISIFKEYPLIGIKNQDFLDFSEIANLIKSRDHLTKEGIEKIDLIKNNMNSRRICVEKHNNLDNCNIINE